MSQVKNDVWAEGKNIVLVPFSFAPNAAGAVVQSTIVNPGAVFSVTRTAVGVFNVKFNEKYAIYIGGFASFSLSAFADTQIQIGVFTAASAAVLANVDLKVETAGAAADIAANAQNKIFGFFIFGYNEKL